MFHPCRGHLQLSRILRSCRLKTFRREFILGIETSCDDTGAAVLSEDGEILGEVVSSQMSTRFGGVIPSLAMGFHTKNISTVVEQTIREAKVSLDKDIKYIAITNRPGLMGSLAIGTKYAKYLSRRHGIPVIPIHHMEAHALTVRRTEEIAFPFLVLLLSGGHCLLAMAEDINRFKLLGYSADNSPGEVLDKAARSLKLHLLRKDLRDLSGGQALEIIANEGGDPKAIQFPIPLKSDRNCQFSFSGLKTNIYEKLARFEAENNLDPDEMLPNAADIAASFQYALARHICHRVQRGLIFCDLEGLWPTKENFQRTLVVSGGVAANSMVKSSLAKVCGRLNCRVVFPPPKYCTDNGVMIAWNGLEKVRRKMDIMPPEIAFEMGITARAPFGEDISERVAELNIKCNWIKIL